MISCAGPYDRDRSPAIQPTVPAKPGLLTAYTTLCLIDGILNLVAAAGGLCGVAFITVVTAGIGVIFLPLAAIPLVVGILELIQYGRLNRVPPGRTDIPIWLAVIQLIAGLGNVLALTTGIIGLIANNDTDVKAWLGGAAYSHPSASGGVMRCTACGYDLRGTIATGGTACPECGDKLPMVRAAEEAMGRRAY